MKAKLKSMIMIVYDCFIVPISNSVSCHHEYE